MIISNFLGNQLTYDIAAFGIDIGVIKFSKTTITNLNQVVKYGAKSTTSGNASRIKKLIKKLLDKVDYVGDLKNISKGVSAVDEAVEAAGKDSKKAVGKTGSGSYSSLPGEGDIGTYRDLLDAGEIGDNITPHHMPSAGYMSQYGVGKKDGLCMNMEMPSPGTGGRYRLTDTYGRNMTDAEKAHYYSLSPRDALAYDIANMRKIYQSQGLYSEIRPKLQEYIKQYKELKPELFDK